MNELHNIHCLGCKTRHETVKVDEIKTMLVKGSPRYQATGICPEGKKWTKILNKKERTTLAHLMPVEEEKEENETPSAESVKIDSESDEKQIDEKTDAPKQKIDSATEMKEIEVAEKEDKTDEILALFDDSTDDLIITQNVEPLQGIEESSFVVEEKENEVFVEPVRDERLLEETRALRNDLRELHRPAPRTESHYQQIKPTQRSRPRTEYISGEQAFKIGKHYGYNEATFSHERYREGLSFHFKQSKINPRFFDAFTQGYIEGGERFLISKQETPAPVSMADEDSSMSPRATAGLAAVSIFGAWVASKINNRR